MITAGRSLEQDCECNRAKTCGLGVAGGRRSRFGGFAVERGSVRRRGGAA